ncbi:MAG: response regulator [Sedimentisphaeraceae bacterium JB056]
MDNHRILIAEDSITQATELKYILEENNYVVACAQNGAKAFEMLNEFKPDVVITDIVMPGMNGYELCRNIRKYPEFSHLPVVLVSSLSDPDDIIEGLNCGADNFIPKPFEQEFLLSRLASIISNSKFRTITPTVGFTMVMGGKQYNINAEQSQILGLFLSSYELALTKKRQLEKNLETLRKTERNLRKAKEEAEDAQIKMQQASRSKDEFLSTVSHEIRTPMSGLRGTIELIKKTGLSSEQTRYIDIMNACTKSLDRIVNDILDISKIESGSLTLEKVPMNLREVIYEVVELNKNSATEKDISFCFFFDEKLREHVRSDDVRLTQIINNLVNNAVKFTEKGTISVSVKADPAGKNMNIYHFCVSDTGIGMEPEHINKIFDRFAQIGKATSNSTQGTGLGLAISKQLVELMGGNLQVVSEPGKGTRFFFTLNLEHSNEVELSDFNTTPTLDVKNAAKGIKILLAEDNQVNQMVATKNLEILGCEVSLAANGQEALEKIEKDRFNMVLMDCVMPIMDGYEATRRIRNHHDPIVSSIPIIATSASTTENTIKDCIKAGMNDCIPKPFTGEQLLTFIKKYIQ